MDSNTASLGAAVLAVITSAATWIRHNETKNRMDFETNLLDSSFEQAYSVMNSLHARVIDLENKTNKPAAKKADAAKKAPAKKAAAKKAAVKKVAPRKR